ncbi:PRC and DUF2382 domain-containing protein [Nonomuraea sp. NPDC048892]|uniref:PRC and DUF2382 domain-containing protein n=1 Tax=Nonomuraea sp. NPDC048892 TaxID=3154624 RepID=UPI0033C859F0
MQTEIRNLLDCHVVGSDGQSIGKVGQVYLNDRTGEPEWVTVRTGFFGMKQTFVPLANARRSGEEIRVPFDKEMIKGAPNIDVDGRLSLNEEADLYRYYGMHPSDIPRQRPGETRTREPITGESAERRAGLAGETTGDMPRGTSGEMGGGTSGEMSSGLTGGAMGAAMPGTTGRETSGGLRDERDIDMIRSEERIHIGKESRESGRVHLHKYVDTEVVRETIPLSHEEVVIEREVIREGETAGTFEIGEEDREMILHEERPVVGKETRPVERVHVHKQDVQHEETVEGQVRKERLEIDEETRNDSTGSGRRDRNLPPER